MNIKMPINGVAKMPHVVLLVGLCVLSHCGAHPHRKRSVSEVQLMHNVWEHRHARDRQDWLQLRLGNIHTGASSSSGSSSTGRTAAQRRPLLWDLPDSKDLTPEQITLALNLLDKVLNSRHSH